jgi:peptidoglycan/xylan/chitin deacetylase (PgdA/CDA1 family)
MNEKKIWLTFDDGPAATTTETVLDTLMQFHIKATFFVIGNLIAKNSEKILRMLEEGHRIGNHTYDHLNLVGQNKASIIAQIKKTENALAPFQKVDPIIRPPYGARDALVDSTIAELGYRQILWNVDTLDWNSTYKPDRWVTHGVKQIKRRKNSIVIMHDVHATTANNLKSLIQNINGLGHVKFEPPATLSNHPVNEAKIINMLTSPLATLGSRVMAYLTNKH